MPSSEIRNHEKRQTYHFYVDSQDEANTWISILMRCTLPFSFISFKIIIFSLLDSFVFDGSPEHVRVASLFPKIKGRFYHSCFILRHACSLSPSVDLEQNPLDRSSL